MRKRILSVFLALCMLLGLMPTALAEEPQDVAYDSWENFNVELSGAKYYHGDNVDDYAPDRDEDGYGSGTGVFDVSLANRQITANETARHKTADILYQPFTISMKVPAYTTYTVTFGTKYSIRRNSDGRSWYYMELFDGVPTGGLSTANNAEASNDKSVYRVAFSDSTGWTSSSYSFTAAFSNMSGEEKTIKYPMAYYIGVSSSTSSLSTYHHRITSSLELSAKSCVASTQAALVGNQSYTELAEAVTAYNAASGATLTMLKDVTGNMELKVPGTVDLNGHTLNGHITVSETSGEVTITGGTGDVTGGKVVTKSGVHDAILHSGAGTLTLSNLWAEGHYVRYGVRNDNDNGTLVLDCSKGTVTVTPELSARKGMLTFKGGWPTIYRKEVNTDEAITTGEGGRLWLTTSVEGKNGHGITLDMTTEQFAQKPKLPYQLACSIGDAPSESNKKTRIKGMDIITNWPEGANPEGYFEEDAALPHFFVVDNGNGGKKLIARCHVVTFDLGESGTSYFADSNERTKQAYVYGQDGTNVSEWPVARDFGVTFEGWVDKDGKTWTKGESITKDLHLYAKWKTVKVNVTFDPNGGTWPDESGTGTKKTTQEYQQPYKWPDRPIRDGYAFAGWSKGFAELSEASIVSTTTEYTVTARWAKDKVEVTFDNEGSIISTRLVEKGGILGNLPTPDDRDQYVFEGWFTAPTGGDKVTSTRKVNEAETYYARWSEDVKKCTVTWDANGGSPATQTTQVATIDYYKLPSEPTRTGYTFDGWFTELTEGTKVTSDIYCRTDKNHTLYAHWTAKTVTVTFNAGEGGTVSSTSKTVTFDSAYGVLPKPTNGNQIFLGWYTEDGKLVTSTTIVFKENHKLVAKWGEKHEHPIGTENPTFTELTASNLASNLTDGVLNAGNYYWSIFR